MTTDEVKGKGKQALGAAKETLGKVTGNKDLEGEGAAQKIDGKVQDTVGRVKNKAKQAKKKIT